MDVTLDSALEEVPELQEAYQNEETTRRLLDIARALEGLPRHSSVHAAAVVIAPEPLDNLVPLAKNGDAVTTQFPMNDIEELGLLKMDFLGLRTLTVVADALAEIERNHGVNVNFDDQQFNDQRVYDLLSSGETLGVFQLEGDGMRSFMRQLKPATFEDIIAGISLFRPGPMDQIPKYLENKHNTSQIKYADPRLEPILQVTYGCIVYQEQVQQIVRSLAGYSMGRADLVRRAMAKKKPEVMERERQMFIYGKVDDDGQVLVPGALRKGISKEVANHVFDEMAEFAKYAFNKAHAACYAVLAYQTAWLKVHYPAEFMAALLTSVADKPEKVQVYIEECQRMDIQIVPPDVNLSRAKFTASSSGQIAFGLSAVKNVGMAVIDAIVTEREAQGPYESLLDFCLRVDQRAVNKRVLESLIKCGAFASTGANRAQLLAGLDTCVERAAAEQKLRQTGQISMFDMLAAQTGAAPPSMEMELPQISEFPPGELLAMEKELLGMYVSGHPLDEYRQSLAERTTANIKQLPDMQSGQRVTIGGRIVQVKPITTKTGKPMMFATLEDYETSIEIVLFPEVSKEYGLLMQDDRVVAIEGKVNFRDDQVTLIAEEVNWVPPNNAGLVIDFDQETVDRLGYLKSILERFPGPIPVYLHATEEQQVIVAHKKYWCDCSPQLVQEVERLFGADTVRTSLSQKE